MSLWNYKINNFSGVSHQLFVHYLTGQWMPYNIAADSFRNFN